MTPIQKRLLAIALVATAAVVWSRHLPSVSWDWRELPFLKPKPTFAYDYFDGTLPGMAFEIEFCEFYGVPPIGTSAEIYEQLGGKNEKHKRFWSSQWMEIREGALLYQNTPLHVDVTGDSNLVRTALRWSGPNSQLGDRDDLSYFCVIRPIPPDAPKGYDTDTWKLIYSSEHTPPPEKVEHLDFLVPPD